MRLNRLLLTGATGILLGLANRASASSYDQIMDSSIGKKPYPVLVSASGGFEAVGAWNNFSQAFRGKPPSVVLFEGPPPRSRETLKTIGPSSFFYLYADHNSPVNHFHPTGYMGDRQDVHIDENNSEDPADGLTCVKITYSPSDESGQGWAGVYWIDPRSNWGAQPAGYNLSGMSRLTFWARGANGGERIAVFKVGGISGDYPDSGSASTGPVLLTKEWQEYAIDLQDVNLSKVSGGFAWSASQSDNVGPLVFYLDDIRYER